jgi:hypothetical protein
MMIRDSRMRVDKNFQEYVKKLKKKLAMERGIFVSERRITLALTRIKGQEEMLLNSDWLDEEIRRTRI